MTRVPIVMFWSVLLAGLAASAAATDADYPPPVPPHASPKPDDWMSLPRLQTLWRREDIGMHNGVADRGTYYTVTNDRTRLVAIDPVTGRDRWQAKLPKAAVGYPHLVVSGDTIVVGSSGPQKQDVQLVQASRAGHIGWERSIACRHFELMTAASRLFLRCHEFAPELGAVTLIELALANGSECARMSIDHRSVLLPNGYVCRTEHGHVSCSQPLGGRLVPRWSRSIPGALLYPDLQGTADYVVHTGHGGLDVMRARDGKRLFHRMAGAGDRGWIQHQVVDHRLFLFGRAGLEVIRLTDGKTLATVPRPNLPGGHVLAGKARSLVLDGRGSDQEVCIADAQGHCPRVEFHTSQLGTIVGDAVLWHASSGAGPFGRDGSLLASSLTRFTPAAEQLPSREKVLAILEHFPEATWAFAALEAIEHVPDGLGHLESIMRGETGRARTTAIAVAGVSGQVRFLPALRDVLAEIPDQPQTDGQRARLGQTVHALTLLDSPKAAEILLAYWQNAEPRITEAELHDELQEKIHNKVWRHSAERDWAACPIQRFPLGETNLAKAVLGSAHPGQGEILDRDGRWALLCQARRDDDGNGKIAVEEHMHGLGGDRLRPYLVLGSGEGAEVDDFLAAEPHGRQVVVTRGTCVYVVDTQTGKATTLRRADGRVRAGLQHDAPAVAFSRDGIWLTYLRSNGPRIRVVLRDLTSGSEREIDPGNGDVLALFFDNDSSHLLMDLVEFQGRLRTQPWATTESDHHICREGSERRDTLFDQPFPLASFGRRQISVHGGPVQEVGQASQQTPEPPLPPKFRLVPVLPTGGDNLVPVGPFRWQK